MGQTLTNGIYLPNEGERNCYSGLAANWNTVDTLKGNYSLHAINVDIHVTAAEKEAWDGKADASALTAHTGDTTIHVTAEDKQAWNGKADASALTAHTGNTTIHGKADASALTAHTGNTTIHVTAEYKAKWDTVTTKANDADVLHKTDDETAAGIKTFSDLQIISYGTQYKGARNAYILPEFAAGYSGLSITTLSFSQAVKIGNFVLDANNKPTLDSSKAYIQIATGENNNNVNACILEPRNSTSSSLGTSSNKWNVINGINPGALGLPNYASRIDISGYITSITGSNNTYAPPADGFVFVRSDNATYLSIMDIPSGVCQVSQAGTAGTIGLYFPVLKGRGVYIKIVCTSLNIAYFIPSQGNA